ncbi:ISL3 family transposase [Streptomyces sp. NPDC085900]|uniref:ISL3 family transposase n=1 Tax=Streptomyces sp. NPDC085900 TaxID=3365737 RepID=UPI0037D4D559
MLLGLFPYLSALVIEEVERRPDRVVLRARVRATTGSCGCGQSSARVHGQYVRRLRDVSVGGLGVVIELRVRRFRCENPACMAVTFAEQISGLTTPHSRHTPLLREVLTQIGLALAGRAGARLASAVGLTIGKDTLLRLVRSLPEPEIGKVEILGVDDFAFRKGRHYGTVLIDMATHRPLHLYDGREGEDLAAWLRDHPEVKVICRDRSSGYGEGARVGAPQADQVADRYHLWANLGQAVEKTVNAHRSRLAEPSPGSKSTPDQVEVEPEVVQPVKDLKIVIRLREQHAAAHELWQQGMSKAAIGRKLGLHQATVRKLVSARSADDVVAKSLQRVHVVDPYVGYLHQRWNEGVRNAAQLYREIKQLGYPGGELAVQRHLRRYRTGRGHAPDPGPKPDGQLVAIAGVWLFGAGGAAGKQSLGVCLCHVLTDFLSVGGIEVINTARLRAYLETVGSPLDSGSAICDCETLTNEVFEQLPYTTPDDPDSPAPWYDPDVPGSADFAGFLPLSFEGIDDYLVKRAVTNTVVGGGALGPARVQPRIITVTGILLGATCCAAEYGMHWLGRRYRAAPAARAAGTA